MFNHSGDIAPSLCCLCYKPGASSGKNTSGIKKIGVQNCVDILCHCDKYAIFVLERDVKLQLTKFKLSALYKSFTYLLTYLLTYSISRDL